LSGSRTDWRGTCNESAPTATKRKNAGRIWQEGRMSLPGRAIVRTQAPWPPSSACSRTLRSH